MKKLFLVDDEAVIRRGIAQKIDWRQEGFIYCGDASDGEMALPLIEKHQPDILITDIKMPFMDGLTLTKIVKEKLPHTKIIILSGHDEFEYAQQAIRLQVEEYCLKPVSSQDLLTILRKIKKEMSIKVHPFSSLETKEELYEQLCKGALTPEEILYQAKHFQIDLMASYYTVLVTEPLDNTVKEQLLNFQPLFFIKETKYIFIFKYDIEQILLQQISKIKQLLTAQQNAILFGLGSIETRTEHITIAYETALEAYSYSQAIQSNTLDKDMYQALMESFDRRELIYFLKFGQSNQLDSFIESYASFVHQKNNLSRVFLYYFLLDFTITIRHYLDESDMYDHHFRDIIKPLENSLHQVHTKKEMSNYMRKMLQPLLEYHDNHSSKYGKVIQQVKQIISTKYHESSLSLQQIANEINISASYLSNIFSKEMDQTITEYITKSRMEHAKELLKTTDLKTYEIAYKVGYNDSHYFCHTFKKSTGMTTKKFKQQVLGNTTPSIT
ncbi:response regulator [Gracilibacillus caseinilyticus]|uniref:Response regulator n=1 Tax=Gracilibacillus caseinilyticus TaxID=2932256 RepID=A0ABY4F0R1_9BACI|nr:response regulator [Gracilibacillus caseinilyticus]UOQ50115.1 response regulator [Gracilibacillus caseinilyticus]